MKKSQREFIEMVLSIGEDDLPIDNAILLGELLYRTDDLNERLDIIEKKINTIAKHLDSIKK